MRVTGKPSFIAGMFQCKRQVGLRQGGPAPLRPLDDQQRALSQQVPETEVFEFLCITDPVQVQVQHFQVGQVIVLQQAVGRALHRARVPQAPDQGAGEGGLAGAEVPLQEQHQWRAQSPRERFGQGGEAGLVERRRRAGVIVLPRVQGGAAQLRRAARD